MLLVIFTNQESGSAAAIIFLISMESLVKVLLITSNKMTRNRKHCDGSLDPVAQVAAETGFFILGFCCRLQLRRAGLSDSKGPLARF